MILNIETATDTCSAALSSGNRIFAERICTEGPSHAVQLPQFIQQLLDEAQHLQQPIEAVAVSAGPGSYTGLRIGVSTAKGICYALGAKLIAIDTLQIIAMSAGAVTELIRPMLDARRMEVYTALYNRAGQRQGNAEAQIVDADTYRAELEAHTVTFCGNGVTKCKSLLQHPHAVLAEGVVPLARNMAPIAAQHFAAGLFEDIAYFTPFYLKEFMATKPKAIF